MRHIMLLFMSEYYTLRGRENSTMTTISELPDSAVLRLLGNRVQQERLNQNLTQLELAHRATLSRIVITHLEGGKGCTLGNFIRILRSLGKLDQVDLFMPEPGVSPLQLANMHGRTRQEASGRRGRPSSRPR
jgi:putative transcriptional regulator